MTIREAIARMYSGVDSGPHYRSAVEYGLLLHPLGSLPFMDTEWGVADPEAEISGYRERMQLSEDQIHEKDRDHARRLIRVGYEPDAVRGMLGLQPADTLWDEVQQYHDEREAHAAGEDQASADSEEDGHQH